MSKSSNLHITINDLQMAIKPLMDAINKLREEQTGVNSQLSEVHQIVTGLSVKFDCVEQAANQTFDEVGKNVTKKATSRKNNTKAAPKKSSAKKSTKKSNIAEPDDAEEDPADDVADDVADDAATEVAAGDNPTADEVDDDASETKSNKPNDSAPTKLPVKKGISKKPMVKKPTAKKVTKMSIFQKAYKDNSSLFKEQLTDKVKKQIENENKEKWESLSGAKLENAKIGAYFHYIKDNHDDVLEDLKQKYIAADDE